MNDYIVQAEDVLSAYARKFVPEGSSEKAVIHQWLSAIAQKKALFSENMGVDRNHILKILKENNLYKTNGSFKKNIINGYNFVPTDQPQFSFIDLFAGIGGFRIALQKFGGVSVFSSEWDRGAQETYFKNYGDYPFGDITQIDPKSVPEHDILAAGFPCQPFSHAGVSARTSIGQDHGFKCKTQGTLFFDVMNIASEIKPKVLFLENVRNIERHDKGYTFKVIQESIEEIGYDFEYAIINSSSLVPQRRVRCYMVCFRKDLNVDFKFPEISGEPLNLRSVLEENVPDSFTISDKLWKGHINRTKRNVERGTGFTAYTANLDKPSNTLVARYGKDGKECLIPQENKNPRLLTPRECARLQGFPENFLIPGARTPAYKQFGNSVAVPVVERIAEKIIREII